MERVGGSVTKWAKSNSAKGQANETKTHGTTLPLIPEMLSKYTSLSITWLAIVVTENIPE
jgi:hypothetical protein